MNFQKILSRALLASLLLVNAALLAVWSGGCSTSGTAAYKAESTVDATVTAAMTAYGDFMRAEPTVISAADQARVKAAFTKFQQAELAAIDATIAAADASTNLVANANASTAAAAVSQAATDLIALLTSLGIKF